MLPRAPLPLSRQGILPVRLAEGAVVAQFQVEAEKGYGVQVMELVVAEPLP